MPQQIKLGVAPAEPDYTPWYRKCEHVCEGCGAIYRLTPDDVEGRDFGVYFIHFSRLWVCHFPCKTPKCGKDVATHVE
jgi:hypothetical protein